MRPVRGLNDRHGFGFEDVSVPPRSALDELHADLHEQESVHHLPTNRHWWEVVDAHLGGLVSPQFDTDHEAERWAVRGFGFEAGKEYVPRLTCEVSEP